MPPKGRKAAATAATTLSEATTRSTRRKRAAEAPPEEEPITQKKTRRTKKATAQATIDEPANDTQAEAPKRRGRLAKTALGPTEAPSGMSYTLVKATCSLIMPLIHEQLRNADAPPARGLETRKRSQ